MKNKKAYNELLRLLSRQRPTSQWNALLQDLLTPRERESLAERLQIVKLLASGMPQREIASRLGVSISKITRGSKVLQDSIGGLSKEVSGSKKKGPSD